MRPGFRFTTAAVVIVVLSLTGCSRSSTAYSRWRTADLTAATGATGTPAAVLGGLAAYVFTAEGTQHVVFDDVAGHVQELWSDHRGWHTNDLTATTGAPASSGGTIAGYALEGRDTQHVIYNAVDGHIHELWCNQSGWHTNDLTATTGAPAASGRTALAAFVFKSENTQHVIYDDGAGHIHELWCDRNGWHTSDLTAAAGAPASAGDTLAGYAFETQSTQHVVYNGVDRHIYELWYDHKGWHTSDLTAATGAPSASGLSAYVFEAQGTEHVIASGVDRHLYQLSWLNSWHLDDLTAVTGAPPAGADIPVGYAVEAQGTQHVFYVSAVDAHVQELSRGTGGTGGG
jgi:Fungal fucose-specific lectin